MGPASEPKGLVFNIQKFSVHDGPGIRTTVFLKGCPLRCFWCCNPESQRARPEMTRNAGKCLGAARCGACLRVCTAGALDARGELVVWNRQACTQCGACAEVCPSGCASMVGRWMSVEEVVRAVSADALFYDYSGGGFTLSGGEPLMQADFAAAVCERAAREGLGASLETCACAPYESMRMVCALLDHVMVDVKHMDPARHQWATGVDNQMILENIRRLAGDFPSLPLTLRMPVIPGFNDTPFDVREVARFAGGFPQARLELLPYHRLGEGKYENLGLDYSFADRPSPSAERMAQLRGVAGSYAALV